MLFCNGFSVLIRERRQEQYKNNQEDERMKTETVYRFEAHLWFRKFDEYAKRERELLELLGKLHGNGSVTVFFRATPEYVEIPGASYDHLDEKQVGELMDFCGRDNIDFVVRLSLDAERETGCLRGKQKRDD